MDKGIWNTNMFFQLVELGLAFILGLFFGSGWFFIIIFYIHSIIFSFWCLVGDGSNWGGLEDYTHMWFKYIFIPFTSFYDTYEVAFDRKPDIRTLFMKKEEYVELNKKKVRAKQEKDGSWIVTIEGVDDSLVIVNNETKNKQLLIDALVVAVKKGLIK